MIDVISRALNPYTQNDEFMKLAEQPEMSFVISNTTEAGIAFDPTCKLEDAPAASKQKEYFENNGCGSRMYVGSN